jgi:hypothetical protein
VAASELATFSLSINPIKKSVVSCDFSSINDLKVLEQPVPS